MISGTDSTTRRRSFVWRAGPALVAMAARLASRSALAAYEVVTVTNGGTIDGVVILSGTAPAEPAIKDAVGA